MGAYVSPAQLSLAAKGAVLPRKAKSEGTRVTVAVGFLESKARLCIAPT